MAPANWHDHEMESVSVKLKLRPAGRGNGSPAPVFPLAGLLFLVIVTASLVTAQTRDARRTVWDGAYTEAQAARGAASFGQSCSGCHVLTAEGRSPLVGGPFWKSFSQKTVGELLDYVSANMPNGNPGSLNETTYNDIVAVMLKSNGFPAGTTEIGRSTNAGVLIIPKDGSTELPADALVRVIGCLARSGTEWVVTRATPPVRAERPVPPGEDATRPLGSRTMPLKFVITRLDELVGSRVAVSGLLIGAGGVDGINVVTVSRVAPRCP
jgi:mono/diheme cytochrome c family protein